MKHGIKKEQYDIHIMLRLTFYVPTRIIGSFEPRRRVEYYTILFHLLLTRFLHQFDL
jgi:hypothetical protein